MTNVSSLTEDVVIPRLTPRTLGGLKVVPVEDRPNFLNVLIYGDPGVGKTLLAGSAYEVEAMSPVLFIDIEGGTFSLRAKYPEVDVVRVQSWTDMQHVYDELYRGQTGYKTIVLDSLTEIQKFSMSDIMRDLVRREPDRDPDIPGMREWGKNIQQLRALVRAFRDLPCNAIFTALAAEEKNPRTGLIHSKPSLSGKLSAEVAGFVDIVLFMYTKRVEDQMVRLLLTAKTDTTIAKDRSGKLPAVVEVPTMATIHQYIFNEETNQE